MKISIIDTGSANLNSVVQAFRRLGFNPEITSNQDVLKNSDRLVLPGVGSAISAMKALNSSGLADFIRKTDKPLLGICLGMQVLSLDSSEVPLELEGQNTVKTLGLVPNHVVKLDAKGLRMPHMGWNTVFHNDHPLFENIRQNAYFYFDHSFAMSLNECTIGTTEYGVSFTSAVAKGNFMGVQFHPEKSSKAGEQLLLNFIHNF